MPDRSLLDAIPGQPPPHEHVQQLIEAESGKGSQGILRRWQASNSAAVVLTSDASGVRISRDAGATAPSQVVVDGTPAGGDLSGTYPNPGLSVAVMDLLVPPGTIWAYGGAVVPAGWVACDGVGRAITSFPKLFAAIGYTYGGTVGVAYNTPNLSGRVVLGVSGAHPLGEIGGTETGALHTHTGSHSHGLNSHTHGPGAHTHLQGSHTHDAGSHVHDISGHSHQPGAHTHGQNGHTHTSAAHGHDINHDHALASGVAVASGAITGIHEGPSAVVNVSASNHAHDVDIPALGTVGSGSTTPAATGGPSNPDTQGPSANNTGTSGAAGFSSTGTPDAVTGGVSAGAASVGTPSAAATDGATGTTATDSSAPAAAYPSGSANLPSFVALGFIIRTGV